MLHNNLLRHFKREATLKRQLSNKSQKGCYQVILTPIMGDFDIKRDVFRTCSGQK
jgi:hypothetical protein